MVNVKQHTRKSKKGKATQVKTHNRSVNKTPKKPFKRSKTEFVDKIIEYESDEMSDSDTVKFFSELVKSGMVWKLQGHYGRVASAMINNGILDKKGNINKKLDWVK